jgi:DNA primase
MARIPDEEIDRIKREVSLGRLVASQGVVLKGTGDNLLGRCPWHEDSTASLVVTASKNLWHCMAGCGGGSVIDWVMKVRGVSFRHAAEILREGALSAAAVPARPGVRREAALAAAVEASAEDRDVLGQAFGSYKGRLRRIREPLPSCKELG